MPSQKSRTWLLADEPQITCFECPAGEIAVGFRAKPEAGRVNEDSAAYFPVGDDYAVLVVADGMGGGAQGEVASSTVIHSIAEHLDDLTANPTHAALRYRIIDALDVANRRILEMGVGAGTTVVVALVSPRSYSCIHAGDSLGIVVGQKGRIESQTMAHSPVGYALEGGWLDHDQAMSHPDRHIVSNMVGMRHMHLQVGPHLRFKPKDTLLLASDGLFDNLTIEEIVEGIRTGNLNDSAQELLELAGQRMQDPKPSEPSKPDDLAVIVFRPGPSE